MVLGAVAAPTPRPGDADGGLPGAVDSGARSDGEDGDHASVVVDPVQDAVGAATGAVPIVQWWHEALADPMGVDEKQAEEQAALAVVLGLA